MIYDDWTRRLRDRLEDHMAEPPDGLWDDIMARMDARRHRTVIVHLRSWGAVAAVVAAVIGGAGYYMYSNRAAEDSQTGNSLPVAVRTGVTCGKTEHSAESAGGQYLAEAVPSVCTPAEDIGGARSGATEVLQAEDDTKGAAEGACTTRDTDVRTTAADTGQWNEAEAAAASGYAEKHADGMTAGTGTPPAKAMTAGDYGATAPTDRARWTVGVNSSGLLGDSNGPAGVTRANSVIADFVAPPIALSSNIKSLANSKETKKHRQPVSLGVSVSYGIDDRLTLRSGLVYTKASSDFTRARGLMKVKEEQKLYYVGVPIGLSCKLWHTGRFKTYVAAEAQADFNVSAKGETDGVKTDLKRDRVQWSVGASAGAEYDFVPQLGVYVEPGLKYYIDNRSSMENVFKDKPCNFSLQIGFRYNIK